MATADLNSFQGFDETSNIWLQPFSALINCMFPVEYVYADWFGWQTNDEAQRADPESLTSPSEANIEAGSRVEGFCIPQFLLRKTDIEQFSGLDIQEHWQPDDDGMTTNDPLVENDEKNLIPIFAVEHAKDDPRYAKLVLTDEWKDHRPRYKDVSYLHHAFLLPLAEHPLAGRESTSFDGQSQAFSYDLHGPVRKLESGGFPSYEADQTGVFKYPDAWPESAMEWLVRPRPSGWPSAELVQDIFDSGCHLAPVGRGKRIDVPVEMINYVQNPKLSVASTSSCVLPAECNEGKEVMDETEWRTSFSVAENKLGESVTPVQRHVMVLLKMIKKFYFPDVISTYYLKNLLFWECEKQDESFWREDNSATCLLLMLDRLEACLKAHHLPHYIMAESNLLQYEDPASLDEAATTVGEVRRNILPKTVSLLRRLQSLTYRSQMYLQYLGLQDHLLKMQEKNLSEEEHKELLTSLHSIFLKKCKDVIASFQRSLKTEPAEREKIENLLNIGLFAYQSILARNLCKLWFLLGKSEKNNKLEEREDDFKSFVKEEVKDLSFEDDDVLALALVFFNRARSGVEPSLAIPGTSAMVRLREHQMSIAVEGVKETQGLLKGLDWLKTSDLKEITEKAKRKLREKSDGTSAEVTMEEIKGLASEVLAALFVERMKTKE